MGDENASETGKSSDEINPRWLFAKHPKASEDERNSHAKEEDDVIWADAGWLPGSKDDCDNQTDETGKDE